MWGVDVIGAIAGYSDAGERAEKVDFGVEGQIALGKYIIALWKKRL